MDSHIDVFDPEFPDIELMVEIKTDEFTSPQKDRAVKRLAKRMWGMRCHYGLIVTPKQILVLKESLGSMGADSIEVTHALPTQVILGNAEGELNHTDDLENSVASWLVRLRDFWEQALPKDADMASAFFPEIVGAMIRGRIVMQEAGTKR